MSWSINIQGKRDAVAAKIGAKFDEVTYLTDPAENTIKNAIRAAAVAAVEDHPSDAFVCVEASGSCNPGKYQNCALKVTQLYGYVE